MPVKSRLKEIDTIFRDNETLQRLFNEFSINYDEIHKNLINTLNNHDSVIQRYTVLNLVENPANEGTKEKTKVTVKADNNDSLNGTYFYLYTPSIIYYIWLNTGTASDPAPSIDTDLDVIGVEVPISTNAQPNNVGLSIYSEKNNFSNIDVDISTEYQAVDAIPEVTSVTCIDDTINDNSNYSGRYFAIFNGTDEYDIWFNVDGSSTPPSVSGTLVEVSILESDNDITVAEKLSQEVAALLVFNSSHGNGVALIETSSAGDSNDAEERTASAILDASIINDGHDAYTEVITSLIIENTEDGIVPNARNSYANSPDFTFKVLVSGEDDPIAILNQEVSKSLKLFPQKIESPHEEHYRDYVVESIAYTYFLKWIYYCYKYFNQEQFFFHNLLEHFVPEYDSRVISSINDLKVYFDGLGIILDTIDQKIEDLYKLGDIDQVDDSYLQYIAQLLGYQKEDFSIKNISFRELIKNLTEIYKKKGTTYSFELFFKLLGFQAELREYYWDRDAQNPENFASVTKYDYLYYLTTQDPRKRTRAQLENMSSTYPIQPISNTELVLPKDLDKFSSLLTEYDLDEVLGFRDSELPPEDRYTYFKTNFINFKLTQFYTKQDLTAKDTETILKYVKFLTPIYVSAFVEVVTTPWEDSFEMSNPLHENVVLDASPGTPPWIDILLPFLSVTLKEYIPFQLSPPPKEAIVLTHYASSDDDGNGSADSALHKVFGDPAHGVTLIGTVVLASSTVDLTDDKYINIKLDKGRGHEITLRGNQAQTWQEVIDNLNIIFNNKGLNITATDFGVAPSKDIRIYSESYGTFSKIYLANGLKNDLFLNISANLETPINGEETSRGYQDFGLSLNSLSDSTGLSPSADYTFYVSIDDEDYNEIDVSGPTPHLTTLDNVVNSINNHYIKQKSVDFITSVDIEYIDSTVLTSNRVAVVFRDTVTNNGKLSIINADGTLYRSGVDFSRFDCTNISLASSVDPNLKRFALVYLDLSTNQLKWTILNNEGDKEINDRVLEGPSVTGRTVREAKVTILENNRIAIAYSTATSGAFVRIMDMDSVTELVGAKQWYPSYVDNIALVKNGNGLVTAGAIGSGGILVYLDDLAEPLTGDINTSTKVFTGQTISNIHLLNTSNDEILVVFRGDKSTTPEDYSGWMSLWNDGSSGIGELETPAQFTAEHLSNIDVNNTENNNIIITYTKRSVKYLYYKVYTPDLAIAKKERVLYQDEKVDNFNSGVLLSSNLVVAASIPNRGHFLNFHYFSDVAERTLDGKLQLSSVYAGDTWDDTVVDYARTSDFGHKFTIEGAESVYDNYSASLADIGIDITEERNKYNTFYEVSPNDDVIPLIEDSLKMIFTVLISSKKFPFANVDKNGFYISRNSYISRNYYRGVEGNKSKSYFTRHQHTSDNFFKDTERAIKEIDWPQWRKGKLNDQKEKIKIELTEDSQNNNSNYNGKYFTIYKSLTKFNIWFDVNNTANISDDFNAFDIVINLTESDDKSDIYNKISDKLNFEPTDSFTVDNVSPLELTANYDGDTLDANSSTASSVVEITLLQEGTSYKYHDQWSSWSMCLDQFKIINLTPKIYESVGGAIFSGFSPQAGPYEDFYWSAPSGSIAGSWIIEGKATNDTIVKFIITDPDPAVVWPVDAKISYVEDYTGNWTEIEDTNRSLDGKTLWAYTNHFSFWGVLGSGPDLSSVTNLEVENGVVIKKILISEKPAVLGIFSGDGQPYGPYNSHTAPETEGGILITGIFTTSFTRTFVYLVLDVGTMQTTGIAEVTFTITNEYIGSGYTEILGTVTDNVVDITGTIIETPMTIAGEAVTRFSDYVFGASGVITLSGISDYSSSATYEAPTAYGWIETAGTAEYLHTSEYSYEGFGTIYTSGITELDIVLVPAITTAAILISGTSEPIDLAIESTILTTAITLSGEIETLKIGSIYEPAGGFSVHGFSATRDITFYDIIATGILTASGAATYTIEFERTGSGIAISINGAEYTIEFERTAEGLAIISGSAEYTIEIERTGSGSISTSGSIITEIVMNMLTSGSTSSTGSAEYTIEFIRTSGGQAIIQGSSAYQEVGL